MIADMMPTSALFASSPIDGLTVPGRLVGAGTNRRDDVGGGGGMEDCPVPHRVNPLLVTDPSVVQ